ncbi:helix-turn-helix domain-containing protein [Litchfieldella xinjiangensis]|uniref:helix-turn-helix domain-containing protein n=1 Tax=Litchfieldella xinjiangensis TaxID=1166948 RepID=UPI0009DEDC5B|nr:helix-turn-helix transcriptional regulator [Halomonas xinjiangensis]
MENILVKFGEEIRKLRTERGLTQEQLAELSNLDRTYISSVERGKRNISLKAIKSISDALNVPIMNIFNSIR